MAVRHRDVDRDGDADLIWISQQPRKLILWIGDILYLYGVCGMLVYLFRNVRPAYLVLGVPLVLLVVVGIVVGLGKAASEGVVAWKNPSA